MTEADLQAIAERLPHIKYETNYWLFRTNAGEYYDTFLKRGFIAIGHNEVTLDDLRKAQNRKEDWDAIVEKIKKIEKENKMPGHSLNQMLKFTYEMRPGDLVMIPSTNSDRIAFGAVSNAPLFLQEDEDCKFRKRRRVKWFKEIRRAQLEANLYKLMFSHHTITKANDYAQYIDRLLNTLYIKGGNAHYVLDVKTTKGISAFGTFRMGYNLLDLTKQICDEYGIPFDPNDVELSCELNSPGKIELKSKHILAIALAAIISLTIVGGGGKIEYGNFKLDLHTDGLLKQINTMLNDDNTRKIQMMEAQKSMTNLQVTPSEDLKNALEKKSPQQALPPADNPDKKIQPQESKPASKTPVKHPIKRKKR
jgi:restriction system protein